MPARPESDSLPEATMLLHSFDGGVALEEQVSRPEKYRDVERVARDRTRIVRGGGYSYAAASFGSGALVQDDRAFNRILSVDADEGIIECEAGTTLLQIYDVITPLGWCLPVQPGYPLITIGGCVAADVHGKNHSVEGTFSRSVISLRLFHPSHGELEVDRERHHEVFDLTCGGLGLTGHILSARIRLQRVPASRVRVVRQRLEDLKNLERMLDSVASTTPMLYTWHNFTRSGRRFGSGFVYVAEFVDAPPRSDSAQGRTKIRTITARNRGRLQLQILNRYTVSTFNRLYEMSERTRRAQVLELFQFLFPVSDKVLFFELFGRNGFHEYQMLLPRDRFLAAAGEIRQFIERNGTPVCLASCKLFRGAPSLLRFDGEGICIALDFPRDGGSARFAAFLDDIVVRYGGIPNIIKDSRLPRSVVEACFPEWHRFQSALREWDPQRLFRSDVSERLGL